MTNHTYPALHSSRIQASVHHNTNTDFSLRNSLQAFTLSMDLMPGGVNSPVRAFKSVGGQPIVIDSVKGSRMWDITLITIRKMICETNELCRFKTKILIMHCAMEIMAWLLFSVVLATLAETMKKGTSVGAPCLLENTLAEMVISAVPSIEMIRSVNSGTEACMGALRLARAFTGKQKIIKFEGCSHAMLILFLLRQLTSNTLTALFNDILAIEKLFENHKGEIAALILEPAVGNSGFIVPKLEFLDTIRKIIKENNALLIFDEVMTGFQLSYGGAQEYFGIVPDLKTLGNIIVSGLPVGAYGGRRNIMKMADTLSGNPLAMAAGIEAQKLIKEAGTYEYLDEVTGELVQGILQVGKRSGHSFDLAKFASFYRGMLEQGVYFASSQFEAGFTSLAHTTEDIKMTIAAAERVLRQIG
uniref:glutamate-1-semialdehyde 2,1-aminomutase n=1 Tax=Glycine max TaxID=3847 RepID=K7M8I7_SOYBN